MNAASLVSRINRHKTWARFLHFHLGVSVGPHLLLGWTGDKFAQIDFLVSLQLSTYILGAAVVAAHFVGVARGYVRPNGVFG